MAHDLATDIIRKLEDAVAANALPEHTVELLRVSLEQARTAKAAGHDQEAVTIAGQALQAAESASGGQ
ncbi:hypothetical protein [Streptomyces avidinii]|uniref:Uncharacterized protein n=1 Tax=Streptomyces avidinii TaxID=1895 RepID=A0ABS4KY45_STRAV|nr:hypothetical protein [Streptomyces avidinii]MBP2034947.1 hypothetical protein [Streptomyces avidinii]GGY90032.1 hypothetical protein GCM10010343_14280 [Streptomyces avidinii]